jgi:nucleotide-binding universal stress UspA family protein
MKPLDRILVATSFSDSAGDALRKAALLAAEHDAAMTLLHVVETVKQQRLRRHVNLQMLEHARVGHARKELARYAGEIAAKQGVPVDFRVEVGERVPTVLQACRHADLLVIGGTPVAWWPGAFQKTTTERLAARCAIPMMIVGEADGLQVTHAVVPVRRPADGEDALRAAERLWPRADRRSVRLHALTGQADMRRRLDTLDADVMVLSKRRRSPSADFAWGAAAGRLLRALPCDVLLIPVDALTSVPRPRRLSAEYVLEGS